MPLSLYAILVFVPALSILLSHALKHPPTQFSVYFCFDWLDFFCCFFPSMCLSHLISSRVSPCQRTLLCCFLILNQVFTDPLTGDFLSELKHSFETLGPYWGYWEQLGMAGVCWRQLGYTGSERDHTGGNWNDAGATGMIGNEHAESTWDILGDRARVM